MGHTTNQSKNLKNTWAWAIQDAYLAQQGLPNTGVNRRDYGLGGALKLLHETDYSWVVLHTDDGVNTVNVVRKEPMLHSNAYGSTEHEYRFDMEGMEA